MKKTTHTAGTKSCARWYEDMVSHLLFKKNIYDSSYFLFTAIFQRQADPEKNSLTLQKFTSQLRGKGEKG